MSFLTPRTHYIPYIQQLHKNIGFLRMTRLYWPVIITQRSHWDSLWCHLFTWFEWIHDGMYLPLEYHVECTHCSNMPVLSGEKAEHVKVLTTDGLACSQDLQYRETERTDS